MANSQCRSLGPGPGDGKMRALSTVYLSLSHQINLKKLKYKMYPKFRTVANSGERQEQGIMQVHKGFDRSNFYF